MHACTQVCIDLTDETARFIPIGSSRAIDARHPCANPETSLLIVSKWLDLVDDWVVWS